MQALLAGALHAYALSHITPAGWDGWLQVLALVWLALLVARTVRIRQAAGLGWLFAFTWFAGSFWWLHISMHQYGGMPALMAAVAVVLLSGGLALIFALTFALVRRVSASAGVAGMSGRLSIWGFSAAWLLAELMRSWLFTGFPWASSGYAHVDGLFSAYIPWIGVYGVGMLTALFAASIAQLFLSVLQLKKLDKRQLTQGCGALALVLALVVMSFPMRHDFTQSNGSIKVVLLQGNVPQELKFVDINVIKNALFWYRKELLLAQAQKVDLVVAPETALLFPSQLPSGMWDAMQADFSAGPTAALVGMPLVSAGRNVTNSVVGFVPGSEKLYRYDKHHLVPFGEFVPRGFRWFVDMMNIPLGDMQAGPVDAVSLLWAGQLIAPNICYEDLFGEELGRRFISIDRAPTVMVNASNIAWFGDTTALPQHLQIARMRALEFQRPMIRATNTGATAIINYQGKVQEMLAPFTQGALFGDIKGRTGLTFYARWVSAWGLLPLWLYGGVVIAFLLWRTRNSRMQLKWGLLAQEEKNDDVDLSAIDIAPTKLLGCTRLRPASTV